jgi:hypothetical protein
VRDVANEDNFFKYYGEKENPEIHDWYVSLLEASKNLTRLDAKSNEIVVYENQDFRPPVSAIDTLISLPTFTDIEQYLSFSQALQKLSLLATGK